MNRLSLLLLIAAACRRDPPPTPPPGDPARWPAEVATTDAAASGGADAGAAPQWRTEASVDLINSAQSAIGKTYMVVSESADASNVGKAMLAGGGNAVDAAVATALALAVTHPSAGNLGGGGFAVVRLAPGKAVALDFREVAPAAATETMYLDADGKPTKDSLIGHRASGVPGSVAGLFELHRKHGKLPWKQVVEPAIKLARDGFTLDNGTADGLARPLVIERLKKFPASAAIWLSPEGAPRGAGSRMTIPDLAAVLQRIADRGAAGFYTGPTAAAIVDEMKAGGGLITAADLERYKPVWRDPLRFGYRGHSLVSMPPPSSGGIVLAMTASMLRTVELGKLAWYGPEHVHRVVETWKRGFAARNELLGDPAFVKNMPLAKLMAQPYLDRLAAQITDKATPARDVPPIVEGDHTTNLCAVDGSGMAVALTTTLNTSFGSGVTIKGAGFLMNNEMDDFTAKPGSPNTFGLVQGTANKIEPGKRMLSSMSPTIVENERGEVVLMAGAGGGPRIITSVWQTISNFIDFHKSVELAVARSRVHHQHLPDILRAEGASIDEATDRKLRAAGHELGWGETRREFAVVTAIGRAPDGWHGTADPRAGGGAAGD